MLQTGVAEQRCEVGEGVRCLDLCWGQLFLGTEGGCGARWNFKVSFFSLSMVMVESSVFIF